ncbi:hypothetical protein HNP84_006118 [Thermocatellispora tengchongensis]|uniref:ATP-grasp domain-containing protein n=1 Tax=Thermocatellispora tengchongensis TaxID=1073253 RepID=A0A840PEV2_9ACTN|nr:ATP-dependent carboxylate-amine ligase [Thermocatellispora tengchongensis]MBB5136371.1 hypothetical protein [Thermocatellispora tengchongensis]
MTPTVLILTGEDDTQARHVARTLGERGAVATLVDPYRLAGMARLSVTVRPAGSHRRRLAAAGVEIDLDTLASVWFRRPGPPLPVNGPVHAAEAIGAADGLGTIGALGAASVAGSVGAIGDLWDSLGCLTVPAAPVVTQRARRKLLQLLVAERIGMEVPATLITTDPDECLDFYQEHRGQIVTMVLDRPWTVPGGAEPPAPPIRAPDGPFLAQAHHSRKLSLRVIVVGERVFAAEIHMLGNNRGLRPHDLPDATAETCRLLIRRLGLCYGTIDLALTDEDRYIFLEVNPTGGYLLIEEATGLPITPAVCDLLLTTAPG